jgi:hypothetical protein
MPEKTCPKCPNSPAMKESTRLGFISALSPDGKVAGPTEPKLGFPVSVYECLHCHLVELYHQPQKDQ